jgi:hypothetical protein
VPTQEDKAVLPRGTVLTGGDRHWRHHRMVDAFTGGDRSNGVHRWDRVTGFPS